MINDETVTRFIKYNRILSQLKNLGMARVFSNNLGDALGITPALVRKDFSRFNLTGNKRGGYEIDMLIDKLDDLLGGKKIENTVIIGCGNIGKALINHGDFQKDGAKIVAGFDSYPVDEKFLNIPIYKTDILPTYIKEHNIKLAILAVPEEAATNMFEKLLALNVKGVLNFTPVELKSSESCIVNNMNIGLEIKKLTYMVKATFEENTTKE